MWGQVGRRSWRTHSCVPCRDSSRHLLCSLTRCASHARGPGVEKSLDAARRSACATSATNLAHMAHAVWRSEAQPVFPSVCPNCGAKASASIEVVRYFERVIGDEDARLEYPVYRYG